MTTTDPSASFGGKPLKGQDPRVRPPLVEGENESFSTVTDAVARVSEVPVQNTNIAWIIGFGISLTLLGLLGICLLYLITTGVGVWGNNNPVYWGWPIVNFVFWVGIGHAGTLISAVLFLTRQNWRTGVNRAAEAMTIFAVVCAGMFPGVHIGRVWVTYWLFPLPNQMEMWPNFRSPLLWDVFAVSTYASVSLLFWYMGMIPDLATLRDRAVNAPRKIAYGIAALGWTGSSRHWHRYERAYLLLAALATPLVLSVHSVVSFDFAVSQVPGWHTTIFPPYFVAGAIFSGFAMVLTLMVPARQFFGLKHIITMNHIDVMCRILMATGMLVGYAYAIEFFIAWYGGVQYESFAFVNRAFGNYWWAYWIMVSCNVIFPQIFWSKKLRRNLWVVMLVSITTNIGMWFERFVITVTSLSRDFVPSSWGYFSPTWVDMCMFLGSFGLFFTLFLLFLRFLPTVAIAEVKTVMPQAHAHGDHGSTDSHSAADSAGSGGSAAPASKQDA